MKLLYICLIVYNAMNTFYAMDICFKEKKITRNQQEKLNNRLRISVERGTPEDVSNIMQEGALVNHIHDYGDDGGGISYYAATPLMIAAKVGKVENMKVLLSCKADPHIITLMNEYGNDLVANALREAARYGKKKCIKLLLEYKTDPFCTMQKRYRNKNYESSPIIYESIIRNSVVCLEPMLKRAEEIDNYLFSANSIADYFENLPEIKDKKFLEMDIVFLLLVRKEPTTLISKVPKNVFVELIVRRSIKKHLVLSEALKGCFHQVDPYAWQTKYVIYDHTKTLLENYKNKIPECVYQAPPLLKPMDNLLVKTTKFIKKIFIKKN